MKNILFQFALLLLPLGAFAQQEEILKLDAEVRVDYMQEYQSGDVMNEASGFKGMNLNLRIDGKIVDGLTYSWRQRFNKPISDASVFDATDWAHVDYTTGKWKFSAGKQVVAIGGYEYDKSPIDVYYYSEYCNHISCYQFGVSASYQIGEDNIMFQFSESPFRRNSFNVNNKELFAYNLMWIGSHGFFNSMYSLNMVEYFPGKFINYIALGSRFALGDFVLELDIMNRALSFEDFLGKNMSVMADLHWNPSERLSLFAKLTYDFNNTDTVGDLCVAPGTNVVRVGGGIEYFPLKSTRNLRLHLNCCYTDGDCPVTSILKPRQTIVDAGVTWRMKLLNLKR